MACLTLFPGRQSPPSIIGRTSKELSCIGVLPDGSEMIDDDWKNGWDTSCIDEFRHIINGLGSSSLYQFSSTGFAQVQSDFEYMWSKYLYTGGTNLITLPGQTGFSGFQTVLLDACIQIPGACETAQTQLCSSCSRAEISDFSPLITLCGCFAPSLQTSYGTTIGDINNVTPECDPLCSQQKSAKKRYTSGVKIGQAIQCDATICVIDNISIGASQSTTGGTAITQVCPSCSDASSGNQCKCIVNVSDSGILQRIDGLGQFSDDVVFNQFCPNALCLDVDPITQTVTPVACQDYTDVKTLDAINLPIPISFWIFIVVIIIICIIVIMAFKHQGKNILVYTPEYKI